MNFPHFCICSDDEPIPATLKRESTSFTSSKGLSPTGVSHPVRLVAGHSRAAQHSLSRNCECEWRLCARSPLSQFSCSLRSTSIVQLLLLRGESTTSVASTCPDLQRPLPPRISKPSFVRAPLWPPLPPRRPRTMALPRNPRQVSPLLGLVRSMLKLALSLGTEPSYLALSTFPLVHSEPPCLAFRYDICINALV